MRMAAACCHQSTLGAEMRKMGTIWSHFRRVCCDLNNVSPWDLPTCLPQPIPNSLTKLLSTLTTRVQEIQEYRGQRATCSAQRHRTAIGQTQGVGRSVRDVISSTDKYRQCTETGGAHSQAHPAPLVWPPPGRHQVGQCLKTKESQHGLDSWH